MISPSAEAQLSEADRQAMIDLYEATNGDEWIHNDNWLGQPGTECDWYGIECLDDFDQYAVVLDYNNLSGSLPASLSDAEGMRYFFASNNQLEGEWVIAPESLPSLMMINLQNNRLGGFDLAESSAPMLLDLRLSGNRLTGVLPEGLANRSMLTRIDVSHNELSGDLPEWLSGLQLDEELNLAGNAFTGSIVPALAAIPEDLSPGNPEALNDGIRLDLRDNAFSGNIEADAAEFSKDIDGWLTLCWNDLQVADESVSSWLADEHHGEPQQCLGKTLVTPDAATSGSWYNPNRSGEGFSIMQLDDGQTMVHWFTYAPAEDAPRRQSWLAGSRIFEDRAFDKVQVFGPRGGEFAQGLPNPTNYQHDAFGDLELAWTGQQTVQSDQELATTRAESPISQHMELVQLTRLAGTSCDNQTNFQDYSGAWYNPDRSGEGFIVEALPDDRAVVYWFTYRPDQSGHQAWIMGSSEFETPIIGTPPPDHPVAFVDFEEMLQPVGTAHGPDFDSSEIDHIDWGSLRLEFFEDGSGRVSWDSELAEFGSGDYAIERLAAPKLADCD
ncbi:MAG: hypothetical protein V2J19_09745 [Wenzhouxiangella sp.]|nr:hypothetical protein [Wenzhouxiangella sp.]